VTNRGPVNVAPPSEDRTTTYWFSSTVLKFTQAMNSSPVAGLTVGTENWLVLQSSGAPPAASPPTQNGALPLIDRGGDHERAPSSE
jgi:hypothetical protein